MGQKRRLTAGTATSLVIASMIGVGVFTTAGFQVADLRNAPAILFAWLLGGIGATMGALAYAELSAALPENGGEVAILGRAYHPALGISAGLVAFLAGFAAPLAASAIAFEGYASAATGLSPPAGMLGIALIIGAAVARLSPVHHTVQRWLTAAKVVLIVVVIAAGLGFGEPVRLSVQERPLLDALGSPAFAIGLIYVAYAYTGWNAATYVAGEIERPERDLPLALIGGTATVTLLYLGVHAALLALAPFDALAGKVDVADAAIRHGLGDQAATVLSGVIAFGLLSTATAFVTTGTAVITTVGHRIGISPLTQPARAVVALAVVAMVMVLTASFEAILTYVGVTLGTYAALAVAGVFVLRHREPELPRPYRAWGHPFTTLGFLILSTWMIGYAVWERPAVGLIGASTILATTAFGAWRTRGG